MGLVTLASVKSYIGESGTGYDTFLQGQIDLISEAIEGYCGRKFSSASYTQKFETETGSQYLFHYPMISITTIKYTDDDSVPTDYKALKTLGLLKELDRNRELEVVYVAGYATIPLTLQHVINSICEEKYNKKKSGVSINFGSDVQRMSIPGTISIDFDYSLTNNDRKNAYGNILGNYMNLLDPYRSERVITGTIKEDYVE